MKLRRPTDFLILEALENHGRNVAPNIAIHTGKTRQNVNIRLPILQDYQLVRKIGPTDRSGLYEITEKGRVVLDMKDEYGTADDFDQQVDDRLSGESVSSVN